MLIGLEHKKQVKQIMSENTERKEFYAKKKIKGKRKREKEKSLI